MRDHALRLGLAAEAGLGELGTAVLACSTGALLLNSLGCRPISHVNGTNLSSTSSSAEAERWWRLLLSA